MINPQISIIVPVYNVEKYLHKCIDSVLAQTLTNFELILVDDGSQDKSGKICDEYFGEDDRIIVIHKKNGGVSSARNTGLDKATGHYICFIDSDDTVDNDYLAVMYRLAAESNADLVICGLKMFSNGKQVDYGSNNIGLYKSEEFAKIFLNLLNSSYLNYVYSKLYKTKLIKNKLYFDQSIDIGEDTIFVLEVLKNIELICISNNKPYNYYLHGSNTLTQKFRDNKYEVLLSLYKKTESLAKNWSLNSDEHNKLLLQRYFDFAIPCIMAVSSPNCSITAQEKINYIKSIYDETTYKNNFVHMHKIDLRVSNKLQIVIKTNSAILLLLYIQIHKFKNRIA